MMEFKNVRFSYNEKLTIKNLSFEIRTSQVLALLGHKGARKTTIFRLILGLISPKKWKDDFDNQFLNKKNNGIYENLSTYENLKFRSKLANVSNKDIIERSNTLLKKFNLNK